MKILILMASLGINAMASGLDQELASYIQTFKLKPLERLQGERVRLFQAGKSLFSDSILSGNRNISCRDCHHPEKGTSDGISLSLGEGAFNGAQRSQADGVVLRRHSPVLYNLGHPEFTEMFWDGRVSLRRGIFQTPERALNGASPAAPKVVAPLRRALDAQTIFPIVNHDEMRGRVGSNKVANAKDNLSAWAVIAERVQEERPKVANLLKSEFGAEKINIGHIGAALGEFIAFEFQATNTPFDEYLRGNKEALTREEKLGMKIFFTKGRCGNCHWGPHLTNHAFQNVGVPSIGKEGETQDLGRYEVDTRRENFRFGFKNPGLRNVALSAPYMHNGVFQNLDEVIDHYNNLKESLYSFKLAPEHTYPYRDIIKTGSVEEAAIIYRGVFQPFLRRGLRLDEDEKELLKSFLINALTEKN